MRSDLLGWPDVGHGLLEELRVERGRFVLIAADGPIASDRLAERLRADIGVCVVSLGQALTALPQPPTTNEIDAACADAMVLTDIDLLFWPVMRVPVLEFLANRSRQRPTIAVWPGEITGRRATYSTPGLPDHHDVTLRDVIVLRPRDTRFPDEVPFEIERILP
jgi:hypothetical protein